MSERATVGRRVAAWLIDGLLAFALLWILGEHTVGDGEFSVSVRGVNALVYFALVLAYFVVWQGLTGVTVGKLVTRIRTVKEDDPAQPPGVGRALARWFLTFADAFPYIIPMLTGFVVALTNKDNKRIGDMVAGTLVVRRG